MHTRYTHIHVMNVQYVMCTHTYMYMNVHVHSYIHMLYVKLHVCMYHTCMCLEGGVYYAYNLLYKLN